MKSLWFALVACVFAAVAEAATISTPACRFEVASGWSVLPGRNSETFALRSAERGVEVNVLAQRAPKVSSTNLQQAANQFLAAAMEQHRKSAESWQLTLSKVESNVSVSADQATAQFFGSDSSGRSFRQLIIVHPGSIVALYADTKSASQESLQQVLSEVVQGMRDEP